MAAPVPSRLPSSTRTISPGIPAEPMAWLIRFTRTGRFFSSLKQGTTTLRVGPGEVPVPGFPALAGPFSTLPPAPGAPYPTTGFRKSGGRQVPAARVTAPASSRASAEKNSFRAG